MNKNKKRQRNIRQRIDYRTGGRVQFNAGQAARQRQEEEGRFEAPEPIEQTPTVSSSRYGGGSTAVTPPATTRPATPGGSGLMGTLYNQARDTRARGPGEEPIGVPRIPREGLPVMPDPRTDKERFEEERGERIVRTGRQAEQIAKGNIPEDMLPKQELVKTAKGQEYLDDAVQMGELTPIEAEKIKNVTPEQVAQMEAEQADRPEVIEAAKMEAVKVEDSPEVMAAQGEVRDESLAKAAKVDRDILKGRRDKNRRADGRKKKKKK